MQQLLTQVEQLTDDRDALDKQVMLADVAASNALSYSWYLILFLTCPDPVCLPDDCYVSICCHCCSLLCVLQVQYLSQQNGYVSNKSDQKDAQVKISAPIHVPF